MQNCPTKSKGLGSLSLILITSVMIVSSHDCCVFFCFLFVSTQILESGQSVIQQLVKTINNQTPWSVVTVGCSPQDNLEFPPLSQICLMYGQTHAQEMNHVCYCIRKGRKVQEVKGMWISNLINTNKCPVKSKRCPCSFSFFLKYI